MSRKNTILGLGALAAFGFASVSFAQCPTSTVPPWSAQTALLGSVAISAGGFDGTSCKLDTQITGNAGAATAFVRDDTPVDEATYRAQFLVNADALTGQNSIQLVRLFTATTDAPAPSGSPQLVTLTLGGNAAGTAKVLNVATVCQEQASGVCVGAVPLTGGDAGVHRVEISWTKGTAGSLEVWVNNTNPAASNLTISANNSAWGGVDQAFLGLASPTVGFRNAQLNRIVSFDEFDSRRTTFIGN